MKQGGKIFFVWCMVLASCNTSPREYVPKPKGYNRIDLPKAAYVSVPDSFPYYFEYSKHAILRADSSKIAEPYWLHIIYPKLGRAEIQITYKDISANPDQKLTEHINDSYKLAFKHGYKAEGIGETLDRNAAGNPVLLFGITGEVPSHLQFYTTDSTKHFLRAAIYFRIATKNDSLEPVINYIKKDLLHMIHTTRWR